MSTPEEYFKLCEGFDWDYLLSDDRQRFAVGSSEFDRLVAIRESGWPNPAYQSIFDAWYNFARHDGPKPQLSGFVPQTNRP